MEQKLGKQLQSTWWPTAPLPRTLSAQVFLLSLAMQLPPEAPGTVGYLRSAKSCCLGATSLTQANLIWFRDTNATPSTAPPTNTMSSASLSTTSHLSNPIFWLTCPPPLPHQPVGPIRRCTHNWRKKHVLFDVRKRSIAGCRCFPNMATLAHSISVRGRDCFGLKTPTRQSHLGAFWKKLGC